jgi:hypothetical protein
MAYRVKKQRVREKVFLPDSEEYFVEFCEFNRRGRDEYDRDRRFGGADFVDTMLRYGVSDYLLPGDTSAHRYTGTEEDLTVYADLEEDLEDWMCNGVARVNKLRKSDGTLIAPGEEGGLGNLPSSPAEPSAAPAPVICDDETPAPPPQ